MTSMVMMSPRNRDGDVADAKNCSHNMTWATRKMGASTRQMWKAKVATVMAGFFFQPRALKGMSQLMMERRSSASS
jgi:hypothetical protein